MIHIGYLSLLLFCISTNMIHSMDFYQDELSPQKMADLWEWHSINSNTTENDPVLSSQKIVTLEELINPKNYTF